MKQAGRPLEEKDVALGRRIKRVLRRPVEQVGWDEMLPEMQNEVIWIMQRLAAQGNTEWKTALAMLRRVSKHEWNRAIPPPPNQEAIQVTKVWSVAEMLASPLRHGDWNLFQELVTWRQAQTNAPVQWAGRILAAVSEALGYLGDPTMVPRFERWTGAGVRWGMAIKGACENGTNFAWFQELVSRAIAQVKRQPKSGEAQEGVEYIILHCAAYGRLTWLQYARAQGCPWNSEVPAEAAEQGHLEMLQYLREHGCPWDQKTCERAASRGHLPCLQYAHEHGCPWDHNTCEGAARSRHLASLQYAHEHGCPWDAHILDAAVASEDLAIVDYLLDQGCPQDEEACTIAIHTMNLPMLRHLHERGVPWDDRIMFDAASVGSLDMIRYIREQTRQWGDDACSGAAMTGQLDALVYLHENGCPWDEETCEEAAENEHLETLRYAMTHGCPFPDKWADEDELDRYDPSIRTFITEFIAAM